MHILKYPSVVIVLVARLTKYQQVHPDIQPAIVYIFVYILIGALIVPLTTCIH